MSSFLLSGADDIMRLPSPSNGSIDNGDNGSNTDTCLTNTSRKQHTSTALPAGPRRYIGEKVTYGAWKNEVIEVIEVIEVSRGILDDFYLLSIE